MSPGAFARAGVLLAALGLACDRRASAPAALRPSPSAQTREAGRTEVTPRRGTPCGALGCTQYASAEEAFLDVIAQSPQVLAVGEAHAPRNATDGGGAKVPSAARRFTEDLLPLLAGRASDLLLESMLAPTGCVAAANEARSKERVVRSEQAPTNQSEYIAMGERARDFGLVPDMLRPDCADIDAMRGVDAGDAIGATLEIIARLTESQAKALVKRDARSDADRGKMVVIYGGALHNDLAPRAGAARWSYAGALSAYVQGSFVALDLIVPEFIRDDETWRSLPWWPAYQPDRLGNGSALFKTGDRSFVLVFARTQN